MKNNEDELVYKQAQRQLTSLKYNAYVTIAWGLLAVWAVIGLIGWPERALPIAAVACASWVLLRMTVEASAAWETLKTLKLIENELKKSDPGNDHP